MPYEYDIWGQVIGETSHATKPFTNAFKYTGEYQDEESGLIYLRARYYDPTMGRFISEDTYEGDITNPLTLNLYTYVLNNPLIYIDPTGHWNTAVTANWTINEMKQQWHKAYEAGGDYQRWANEADKLRNQMRSSGIAESDIMQSSDDMIPEAVVMQIAKSGVEEWKKQDPLGFGLYFTATELSVPTSEVELALSFTPLRLSSKLIDFRTTKLLDEHFDKHVVKQMEFGPITKSAYLAGARKLYNSIADGQIVLTKSRTSDKATMFYKTDTNEFLSVSHDGFIKTYFKPTDGLKYWERQ